MKESKNGLNLPIIKKGGELSKPINKGLTTLDLNKSQSLTNILKSETSSAQKEVLKESQGLDLVLVGDLTGSMYQYHSLLKSKFVDLCNELFPLINNLKIGIIFYLDHGSGDPYVTRVQKLTSNIQELIHFINSTSTGSGGDADEAVEDALYDLKANMNWKETNAHSVVIFGDASPHSKNECPHHHDFFSLTSELYQMGISINSVYCKPYPQEELQKLENINVGDFSYRRSYLAAPKFFSWIANITGGMVISIENIEDLMDIIKASAAKDSGHLDELETKMKAGSSPKLKLIQLARKAEERKKLGGDNIKFLK